MDNNPNIQKKEGKKKLSSFLPKSLIDEINQNVEEKEKNHNHFKNQNHTSKQKEFNLNSNKIITPYINGNHNHTLEQTNLNYLNGSLKHQNLPHFKCNGFQSNNSSSFTNSLTNLTNHNNGNILYVNNYLNKCLNGKNGKLYKNGHNINNIYISNDNILNQQNLNSTELMKNNIAIYDNINQKNGYNYNSILGNNMNNTINNNYLNNIIHQLNNNRRIFENNKEEVLFSGRDLNHLINPNENNYVNNENYQSKIFYTNGNSNNVNDINNINNINSIFLNNNIQIKNQNYNFINDNNISNNGINKLYSNLQNNLNSIYNNNFNINKNHINGVNGINGINGINSINSLNSINTINNINGINGINSINSINSINNINSININEFNNTNNDDLEMNSEGKQAETDIVDPQIEEIFSEIYNLPSDKSPMLYLINKMGVDFFVKLIKTHKGSKHLQKLLSNNKLKEHEINYITKIICQNFNNIICDYYGNYFLQKFFKFCSQKNRLEIYKYIKPNFIKIANDICGNHSLQCLILLQNSKEERKIIKECTINNLPFLCFNQKSSHVIQKIIKALKDKDRGYLNNFIINNLINLCLDANGICIVKEFMNNIKNNYLINCVINSFEIELEKLCVNQYGNFGIQEAIKLFGYYQCNRIIKNLINNILFYASKKYSSNVICFLLNYLKNNNFCKLLKVIKFIFNENNFCNNSNNNNFIKNNCKILIFQKLISNQYGIYIIFTLIQILIDIDEDFYNEKIINNDNDSFINNKKNENHIEKDGIDSDNNNNSSDSDDNNNINIEDENDKLEKIDFKEEQKNEEGNNHKINMPFDEFVKLKKGIFLYIENYSQNKEKKKLINLMKLNKIENTFLTMPKKEIKNKNED